MRDAADLHHTHCHLNVLLFAYRVVLWGKAETEEAGFGTQMPGAAGFFVFFFFGLQRLWCKNSRPWMLSCSHSQCPTELQKWCALRLECGSCPAARCHLALHPYLCQPRGPLPCAGRQGTAGAEGRAAIYWLFLICLFAPCEVKCISITWERL